MDLRLLNAKTNMLAGYVSDLQEHGGSVTLQEYLSDRGTQYKLERILELLVSSAMEVSGMLYLEAGARMPDSFYDAFIRLPSIGLVKTSLAKEMASMGGFRNRLVHEYEHVDPVIAYANVAHALRIFPLFIEAVRKRIVDLNTARDETESGEG